MSEAVVFEAPKMGKTYNIPPYGGIIGWWCPVEMREVGLDHFHNDGYDHTPMPTLEIDSILKDANDPNHYHTGQVSSPSIGFGCVRQTLIERGIGYKPDPVGFNSREWGKAVHSHFERVNDPGWWHEYKIPPTDMADHLPVINGIPMRGTIDRLRKDMLAIEDYKTQGDRAYSYHMSRERGVVKAEAAGQINLYRIMLDQLFGKQERSMKVWYGAMTAAGNAPWDPCNVPVMSIDEIMAIHPGGSEFTVGQIFDTTEAAFCEMKSRMAEASFKKLKFSERRLAIAGLVKEMLQKIPFVGAKMFNGSKCYKYCGCPRECAGIGYVDASGDKLVPPTGPVHVGKGSKKSWLEERMGGK